VTDKTLLRWNREVLAGTASKETKRKLIAHVRKQATFGFIPSKLHKAYMKAVCDDE